MNRLKEEGKVRLIGQSAYSHKDFVKLIPKVKPDVLQSFANPVERDFVDDGNPTRKLMEENQISFVASDLYMRNYYWTIQKGKSSAV